MRIAFNAMPVVKFMDDIENEQLPFAVSLALTRTAEAARRAVIQEFKQKFDRPKPSTINETKGPLYLKTASKRKFPNDFAEVRIKDTPQLKGVPAIAYLGHHVNGGPRISKRMELQLRSAGVLMPGDYAIPGAGARMDRYGNMSQGQVQEVLSAMQAQRLSYMNSKKEQWKGIKAIRMNPKLGQYFVAYRGRPHTRHLAEGIWQRYGRNNWQVRPVLIFVKSPPTYRPRIAWDQINQGVARFRFPVEFRAAMKRAVETARVMPNPLVTRRAA